MHGLSGTNVIEIVKRIGHSVQWQLAETVVVETKWDKKHVH